MLGVPIFSARRMGHPPNLIPEAASNFAERNGLTGPSVKL
jgi:hypothetical protein